MSLTFGLYTDAGLTIPLASNLFATQASDGSTGPVNFQLWLGSNSVGKKIQADSSPGVAQIALSIADSTPGVGHLPAEVKLALTQGALAAATGGASLNLGLTILSGASNAVTFWVRVNDVTGVVGTETQLSVNTNTLRETAV